MPCAGISCRWTRLWSSLCLTVSPPTLHPPCPDTTLQASLPAHSLRPWVPRACLHSLNCPGFREQIPTCHQPRCLSQPFRVYQVYSVSSKVCWAMESQPVGLFALVLSDKSEFLLASPSVSTGRKPGCRALFRESLLGVYEHPLQISREQSVRCDPKFCALCDFVYNLICKVFF